MRVPGTESGSLCQSVSALESPCHLADLLPFPSGSFDWHPPVPENVGHLLIVHGLFLFLLRKLPVPFIHPFLAF